MDHFFIKVYGKHNKPVGIPQWYICSNNMNFPFHGLTDLKQVLIYVEIRHLFTMQISCLLGLLCVFSNSKSFI